jgi:prepilin-type N-terminal cleavage/methylation domain-containing protein
MGADCAHYRHDGFTLIELSIVLVIIGLMVGGILVGQNLINAAAVRATISQIEKYNTAANTFREKYGYLPGDIPDPQASSFGFIQRSNDTYGRGDGNGVIEGSYEDRTGSNDCGTQEITGETVVFWVDLSTAHLIDGGFNTASNYSYPSIAVTGTSTPSLSNFFPQAKLGGGNYVYVWSGSSGISGEVCGGANQGVYSGNGVNYFGITAITAVGDGGSKAGFVYSTPGLTANQAYSIDSKIDDGFPQSGNVTAVYVNDLAYWAGTSNDGAAYTTATPGSATSCFDNSNTSSGTPGVAGATQHYSLEISNGSNVNCALTFKMQAGD